MMNDTELSDLLFVCNDGVRLYASRLWLRARSLVFRKTLSPDIKEIALDDVSSRELSIVFEFLYTGSVPSFVSHISEDQMDRWSKGLATIRSARHLLLPKLERQIWNFLIIDVCRSAADKDLTKTAVRLSAGLHLRLRINGGQRDHESQSVDDGVICLREYLRLRQVLLWCISQRLDADPAVSMLEQSLPCANAALKLLKEPAATRVVSWSLSRRKRVHAASALAKAVLAEGSFRTIFVPFINLRLVHPVLLVKVLEPLKIFPPSKYMEAYRFHALKRPFHLLIRDFTWQYYKGSFDNAEGGILLKTGEGSSGTAMVSSAAFWEDRAYTWDVIIERIQVNRAHEGITFQWETQEKIWALRLLICFVKFGAKMLKGAMAQVNQLHISMCFLLSHGVQFHNVQNLKRSGVNILHFYIYVQYPESHLN
ncbi:hypothetical protein R1sor_024721 [Riccia sorocarpa]|uniref:BTB domain-containing protein n=1 Tax=Riccia sorocarpa TaxID=122646 RepID=A0ABD3GR99_9MARC